MAVDNPKQGAKGGDPSYDTSKIPGVTEERGIVTGVVKANVHGANMGVMKVWISTFSTDETDKPQWRTVRYCSPFYSRVNNTGAADTYFGAKVPAGIVTPPPDLGTKVLCFFPEGRNSEGYYFACVPDLYMMQTLPEPTVNKDGIISAEFNDNPIGEHNTGKITNWSVQNRPEDYFNQNYLVSTGLSTDSIRGLSTSGYMRESPSELMGLSSKGRRITTTGQDFTTVYNAQIKNPDTADKKILEGLLGPMGRRKGHSITLDDGDIDGNSNQVRLRTSTGHQLLMNDSEGVIYIGNSDGSCWIELSNEGTVDVYADNSINFRSTNINFHADENIKFHSKGYTQIVSDVQLHLQGTKQTVITSEGETGVTGKAGLHLNSGAELFATSSSASYYNAGGNISVAGSLVLLQGPKTPAKEAKIVNELKKNDVSFDQEAGEFTTAPNPVSTTVDRVVTHEPFELHNIQNFSSPYTGGLVGGGGGLGGAFSIVGGLDIGGLAGGLDIGGLAGGLDIGGLTGGLDVGSLTGGLDISSVTSGLGDITSNLPVGNLAESFSGASSALSGADLGKFVTNSAGKITSIAGDLAGGLPDASGALSKIVPSIPDNLGSVLNQPFPLSAKLPITDMVAQVNTGFSVGALDSFDMQGLNAAVVKQVGSLNNSSFIDSATKSVGKFGFNVDQLKTQGYVRAEAVFNDQLSDSSVWTGKAGASSLNKFLGNTPLQEAVQQGVVATDYQKLVNLGGITALDGKKEVMSMLTASNISTPEIVSAVRGADIDIGSILPNTTNIPGGAEISVKVQEAMQTGASAADKVDELRNPSFITNDVVNDFSDEWQAEFDAEQAEADAEFDNIYGGDGRDDDDLGTVATSPAVATVKTSTADLTDYGPNTGKINDIDKQLKALNTIRFKNRNTLPANQKKVLKAQILSLRAQRNELAGI